MALLSPNTNDASSPVYRVWSGQAVGAGSSITSGEIPCAGFSKALVLVTCDQTHSALAYASEDGSTFFNLYVGGLNGASPGMSGVGSGSRALSISVAGARFLRVAVVNSAGSAGTATMTVVLFP